ncbi:MAG: 4-hydroxy-tetrahydrodipicolinate reductase [Chlamydiota bacterium]
MTIGIAVLGATGRVGSRILELAGSDPEISIRNLLSINDITNNSPLIQGCDVAIDFTSAEATQGFLEEAVRASKPLVIGTTGHSEEAKRAIRASSEHIPILYSPNFSLGIALCLQTAAALGKALFGGCTIDIIETHHVHKKDSPSGTAIALADAIAQGKMVVASQSSHPRSKQEIVIHSIRSGEAIGEHLIVFEWGHERIELKHTAHSRDAFAHGALLGAKFLVKQPPGLYSLQDMFSH